MDLFQIDDQAQLYISPDIDDWQPIMDRGIKIVFDLDEHVDVGVPAVPDQIMYVYFPFEDKRALPEIARLHALADLGAALIAQGNRILVHCAMGHNRSALLAGMILTYMGWSGSEALVRLRARRTGALYNEQFAEFLRALPPVQAQLAVGTGRSTLVGASWVIPEEIRPSMASDE